MIQTIGIACGLIFAVVVIGLTLAECFGEEKEDR